MENAKYTMLIENMQSGGVKLDQFSARHDTLTRSSNTVQTDYFSILFFQKNKNKSQSALVNFVLNI